MTYIKHSGLVQALWAKSTIRNNCAAVARSSGSTPPQASLSVAHTLQSYHPSWLNSWSGSSPENPKSVPKEMGQVHVTNHNMKQALKWPILRYRNNQGLSQGFPKRAAAITQFYLITNSFPHKHIHSPDPPIGLTFTSGSSCHSRFPQASSTNTFRSLVDSVSSVPTLSHQQ